MDREVYEVIEQSIDVAFEQQMTANAKHGMVQPKVYASHSHLPAQAKLKTATCITTFKYFVLT